jgi:hypothetical protein
VNWVVPLPLPSLSFGLTAMLTPLLGFEEETVSFGVTYIAVIVVLALIVTLVVRDVPASTPFFCHFWKMLPFAVEAAARVTVVPLLYLRVNCVVPLVFPSLSAGDTAIATPLLGLDEATVNVYESAKAAGTPNMHIIAMILSSANAFFIMFLQILIALIRIPFDPRCSQR